MAKAKAATRKLARKKVYHVELTHDELSVIQIALKQYGDKLEDSLDREYEPPIHIDELIHELYAQEEDERLAAQGK
jgi:hypothetical protein